MKVSKHAHGQLLGGISFGAMTAAALVSATPAFSQAQMTPVTQSPARPSDAAVASQDEGQAADDQGIVVTGYRASLRSAIDSKRNADVQIDEINAEDIANFPDANLAESLQRLPGVSIDRDNGEGRTITVRGLGGDFNRTRINGLEALATAGANDSGTSPNRSRAFDYNTFASELFSSLRVQKTSSAVTDEGSLGANIDLQTGRPFDTKKSQFGLSGEGSYQKNSKKWSPRVAGLASTRFLHDTMGILVSGAYSKSDNSIDQYLRSPGSADYLYRGSQWAGAENPPRAGFSAPVGTTFGSAITNPDAIGYLTGSDPTAYANLYPGGAFSTDGRYNDSRVRIPALPALQEQRVRNDRLGLTASYQWQIGPRTRLSIDGLYSRFHNTSTNYQVSTVGLNRNNTNATYNTAGNNLSPSAARALYPGLCTASAGSDITAPQDCGGQNYGTTPAFGTALDANGNSVASVLGTNIFSTNPYNLDPYDYYNNPNSVGYIASANRLAYRGALIGRPAVDVLESHVTNGVADYLVLRNVDFRSAADMAEYTTTFKQGSINLDHEFSDNFKVSLLYGQSRSENVSQGLLVEFNRMDSPGNFVYDERDGGHMPVFNLGFDAADPNNWETVKGFSAIRNYMRYVTNTYEGFKADFDWQVNDQFRVLFGGTRRNFGFSTAQFERSSDLLNPTLKEAGVTAAQMGQVIQFGQGLNVPEGTATSFYAPDIAKFQNLFDFTCNCINKWGDWRISDKRNNTTTYSVDEKDTAFYLQFNFDSELFGKPFRGNVGTRVAITDVDSNGRTTAGRPINGTNEYTDFLPSMNLIYEPVRNLLVRFGASQVMARPLLANLSPTVSSISVPNTGDTTGGTLTVGNPKLSPFRSTNLDLSVEWYFAPGGLLSVAVFDKEISSFPQTVLYSSHLSDFLDADAIAALRAQFTNQNQINYIDGNYEFTARQYRDAPGGYLRGIEVSWQQDFTFLPGFLKHFGAQLNYTYIKSSMNYILDPGATATAKAAAIPATYGKGPFLNVSPQALNGTLYYETDRFQARVSVAYRKGYSTTYPIAAGNCSPGLNPTPTDNATEGTSCDSPLINDFVFSRSTTNVDFSTSYKINSFFTIYAEGLNLTNQPSERYAYQDQPVVTQYAASGAIYRIGARVRF